VQTEENETPFFKPPLAVDQSNSNNIAIGGTKIFIDSSQGAAGWGTTVPLPVPNTFPTIYISAISYVN
jgi:hypothetical protein